MNMFVVSQAEAGQKILNLLQRRIFAPLGDLRRWLRTGQVRLNSGRVTAQGRVQAGDEIRLPPFAQLRLGADDAIPSFPLAIFENAKLLVIAKPAGLPSQGGSGQTDSLAARLRAHFSAATYVPAPAHRLDKDTSGLILAGKTYQVQRWLSDAFATGGGIIQKDYLAWVWGEWPHPKLLELHDLLRKDDARRKVLVDAVNAGSVEAFSLVLPIKSENVGGRKVSLLLCRLLSGRTHQIRAQLSSRGFPLVGDTKYGAPALCNDAQPLRLHACRLTLPDGQVFVLLPPWEGLWALGEVPAFPAR